MATRLFLFKESDCMKISVPPDKADDCFPGFPVVLATVSGAKDNIITLAMCHVFSFKPLLIGVGIAPKRFSYTLFKESRDFAINVATEELLRQTELCGSRSGRTVDKFAAAKLTKEKAEKISAPLIAESPFNIECVKVKEVETGDHTWFIGEVVAARMDESYRKEKMLLYWGDYRVIGNKVD